MGSSASKQAGKAAATSRRQYPSTSSILNSAPSTSHAPSTSTSSPVTTSQYQSAQVRPSPTTAPPSSSPTGHIELDGRDPQFGSRLSQLGPAISASRAHPNQQAFPTSSQPPLGQHGMNIFPDYQKQGGAGNTAMRSVRAREEVGRRWDVEREELGRKGKGRTLVSAREISEALRLRARGVGEGDVERRMGLREGLLGKLGPVGVVSVAEGGGGMTDSALVLDR